jgi:ribosomal protein L40E
MEKKTACRKCGGTIGIRGEAGGEEKMWMVKCRQCGEENEIPWSKYGGFSVESAPDQGDGLDKKAILEAQEKWEAANR